MRTTLTIDDRIAKALKALAHRSGKSFKRVVNETLQAGLAAGEAPPRARRYRVQAVSLGGVVPGIDLTRPLRLADALLPDQALAFVDSWLRQPYVSAVGPGEISRRFSSVNLVNPLGA